MKRLIILIFSLCLFASVEGQSIIRANGNARAQVTAGVEPQNLIKYSEDLTNAVWAGSGFMTANQEHDLNNELTMELISGTTGFTFRYDDGFACVVVVPGTTYRFSFDVQRGTATECYWSVYDFTNNAEIVAPESYYAQTSNSVQRIYKEFTAPAGCTKLSVYLIRDTPSGDGTMYYGRLQVAEVGRPYIKTEGSIVP